MPGTPRTLIADDQPDVLEALRLLLKSEGYQIDAANSPAAVLDKLQAGSYDVLLMDLNYTRDTTSGQEGLDLISRIQDIDDTLPVVAMTAWGSIDLAVEAMRRGVRDFVLKPWDNSRLLATLRSQIADGQSKRREISAEREEFEDARAVGQALLPKSLPRIPGFEIEATTRPYRSLSGDYFDVVDLGQNRLALAIGDVTGKGVPAALLMSNVQASVRLLASGHTPPAELADKLNRSIGLNTTAGKFVTLFYCVADLPAKKLTYTSAGHCSPILIRANGEVLRLAAGGAVLGILPDWKYEQAEALLESGDRLLLFTDGITEVANTQEEEFGEERLVQLASALRDLDALELKNRIMQAVSSFTGGRAQDDATLVVAAVE